MPALTIRKSIVIQAPVEKVYATVRNFREWPRWSPWVICEPDCPLTYAADNRGYTWDGQVIGSGGIEIETEDAPRSIGMKLAFLKPWKSESKVGFAFRELGEDRGVEVTWSMDGSLPAFLFFLKDMMTAMLGSDYERGLMMLKDVVETGSVPFKLDFAGRGFFGSGRYVGIRTKVSIDDIGPSMEASFRALQGWLEERGLRSAGRPISLYHKWNFGNGTAEYTAAIPVPEADASAELPPGFEAFSLAAGDVQIIRHTGPYRYLGNAWAAAMIRSRALGWKCRRGVVPFEVYENDPALLPETEWVTAVCIPVK